MYLFVRQARMSGQNMPGAMSWAAEITQQVRSVTGLEVELWTEWLSPEPGKLAWTTVVPDLSTMESAFDKLLADSRYNELGDAGFNFALPGSLSDGLATFVHPTEMTEPRPAEYAAVVETTIANSQMARGVAVGVQIAQKAEQITGVGASFLMQATGNYGGAMWITRYADAAEAQRCEQALNTDPEFIQLIDSEAGAVYAGEPGASTQRLYRKLA